MRVDVVTIFPDYLQPLTLSLVGKAVRDGLLDLHVHDLRTWTHDRHRSVDDTPVGGGAGMVMRPDVWGEALDDLVRPDTHILLPSPGGQVLDQALVAALAAEQHLLIACGRYEGIDARVAEHYGNTARLTEVSLGDYVVNGGEVAALVIVEAVGRLLPGVVGNPQSLVEESHVDGLLEYPVYTRPPVWRDLEVPGVLTSGHHAQIARWRRDQSLRRTAARRPDLLSRLDPNALDDADRHVLDTLDTSPPPAVEVPHS
ncbi:MAG: tRNA (guanosine(37)-N1)-methyltransferase TrmD [Micrococcales bacterium]|nr:tRNA (guanosine(37)-N1)-methyltransferase TrmD [Micrococcales bacterium]MCL2666893.1 tRNA (guanosine(37)-N1)-methyltransferase TrmD [Micrococcales bacterium]